MLRTGELLDPLKGLCHGASPVGSRLAAAVGYRAAWSLPGPDSHWLVDVILREITLSLRSTSFLGCPATGHAQTGASPFRYRQDALATAEFAINCASFGVGARSAPEHGPGLHGHSAA